MSPSIKWSERFLTSSILSQISHWADKKTKNKQTQLFSWVKIRNPLSNTRTSNQRGLSGRAAGGKCSCYYFWGEIWLRDKLWAGLKSSIQSFVLKEQPSQRRTDSGRWRELYLCATCAAISAHKRILMILDHGYNMSLRARLPMSCHHSALEGTREPFNPA